MKVLVCAVALAAAFWFAMFSPWTAPSVPFWPTMAAAGATLAAWALLAGRPWPRCVHSIRFIFLVGISAAVALWCVFWLGDKVSRILFDFARPQVDAIYGLKAQVRGPVLAVVLLFVVGPAEEIFWRGYVQRRLSECFGVTRGFVVATVVYALIHVWSFNFMLVAAAATCGVVWGGLYRMAPRWLPAWTLSHALWDAAAFVWFPF